MPAPIPELLQRLCDVAGRDKAWKLHYATQADRESAWRGFAIHPMQVTETAYQRWVLDALDAVHDGADDARRKAESDALGRVFQLTTTLPALVSGAVDGKTPALRVERAVGALRGASARVLQARAYAQPLPDLSTELGEVRSDLLAALLQVSWSGLPDALGLPELTNCLLRLGREPNDVAEMQALAADVASIIDGFASVQVSESIDAFYLFRLLIRMRVEAEQDIDESLANEASGAITGLLHNDPRMAWLSDWLFGRLCDLATTIRQALPEQDVIFFLKGGRAMQDDPRTGQNDWDTQLVINPYLPVTTWYRHLAVLHDILTVKLAQYKNEFYLLLSRERRALEGYVAGLAAGGERPPELLVDDDEEGILALRPRGQLEALLGIDHVQPAAANEASAKAELIDVGIPRRESAEAFEQWSLVRPRLVERREPNVDRGQLALVQQGGQWLAPYDARFIHAPSGLFFVIDFLTILREVFAGESRSPAKASKRIKRLYAMLMRPATTQEIEGELLLIGGPLARPAAEAWQQRNVANDGGASTGLLIVFMRQLVRAYDLLEDRDFARFISELTALAWAARGRLALPEFNGLDAAELMVARTVKAIQEIGNTIVDATRARAAILPLQDIRRVLVDIQQQVRQLAAPRDGAAWWPPVLALAGSAAVNLHARALGYERRAQLEPVYRVDARIFVPPGTNQDELRTRLLTTLQVPNTLRVETPSDSPPGTMLLFSRLSFNPRGEVGRLGGGEVGRLGGGEVGRLGGGEVGRLGGGEVGRVGESLDVQALVLRITTQICERPPLPVNLELPVLSLRELLLDYTREAGEVDEFTAHGVLVKALAAIRELLTTFETSSR
jgi:hypothetical protein